MVEAVSAGERPAMSADKALGGVAALWLAAALVGQWAFVTYILTSYGYTAARGNIAAWSERSLKGYEPGDTAGNLVFGAHVLMAAVMTFGGALQLVPQIRARARALHRWNGRVFLITAFTISLGGLYLVWVRHATTTLIGEIGITLNALLIFAFGALAWRNAAARNIASHRRWAMRTFMVANGVWFMRLGYMAWTILNQGPVGMGDNLDGPFDIFLGFAAYLVPLAVLEVYLRVRDHGGQMGKAVLAGLLLVLTALTAVGVFGAAAFMWGPRIAQALAA
jgi:hypothetical protein